jgi:transposase
MIIACDFHPTFQVIAQRDEESGEVATARLEHTKQAREFYQQLPPGTIVVAEASGHMDWFRRMLNQMQHQLILGDAAQLRRMMVRKQRTDERDALRLLAVYERGDFPEIWLPDEAQLDVRQLLLHRHRLVQMRTRVQNQLRSIAVNHGLLLNRQRLWTAQGRAALEQLVLAPWTQRRRNELLSLLDQLEPVIAPLDTAVELVSQRYPEAERLRTHPGVGAITALAFVLYLGTPDRFSNGRQVGSYFGLIPSEESSGRHRQRLGKITKQGNSFVRFLLVQAAQTAARKHGDAELARRCARLTSKHGHAKAKVAVARRLAIRLWLMWRKQLSYTEFMRPARMQARPSSPVV